MEPAFWELFALKARLNWEIILWKKKKKPTHYFIEAKFSSFFYQKVLTTEKDFWGLPAQADFPHKCTTLDRFGMCHSFCKTFFHSWPSKTHSSKLHYYFFLWEQIDHNTIRKRRESVCLALYSLWCSLERNDCKERKAGKERLTSFASFPWGVFA